MQPMVAKYERQGLVRYRILQVERQLSIHPCHTVLEALMVAEQMKNREARHSRVVLEQLCAIAEGLGVDWLAAHALLLRLFAGQPECGSKLDLNRHRKMP